MFIKEVAGFAVSEGRTLLDDAIGDRIRELRKKRRWSQRLLGQKAGTSGSYISQLEAGLLPKPGAGHVQAIATALGVAVGELMGDEDVSPHMISEPQRPIDLYVSTLEDAGNHEAIEVLTNTARLLAGKISARKEVLSTLPQQPEPDNPTDYFSRSNQVARIKAILDSIPADRKPLAEEVLTAILSLPPQMQALVVQGLVQAGAETDPSQRAIILGNLGAGAGAGSVPGDQGQGRTAITVAEEHTSYQAAGVEGEEIEATASVTKSVEAVKRTAHARRPARTPSG